MNLLSRAKRPLSVAALLLTLTLSVALLQPGKADCKTCPTHDYFIHYYSDATYTNRIGVYYTACDWHRSGSGSTSPYYVIENLNACCGCSEC